MVGRRRKKHNRTKLKYKIKDSHFKLLFRYEEFFGEDKYVPYRSFLRRIYGNPPKDFIKPYNRKFKRSSKHVTRLNQITDNKFDYPYPIPNKNSAKYHYW